MYGEYNHGNYAEAEKTGGAGLGAIMGAEVGLQVSEYAMILGPEMAIAAPLIVGGFALAGAWAGGNGAAWIYNLGFDGTLGALRMPYWRHR